MSYRPPIGVVLLSIVFIILQFTYLEAKTQVDVVGALGEGFVVVFILIGLFIVQSLRGDRRVYLPVMLGLSSFYFYILTEFLGNFLEQSRYVKYVFEDAMRIMGIVFIALGAWRWIKRRDLEEKTIRESASKYKGLVEASLDAIISIDEDDKITLWNKAAQKVFGYTKEEILGKPVTILMSEEYKTRHTAGVKRYLKTGVPKMIGSTYEAEGLTKDGRSISLAISLSEEKLENKSLFLGILRDITERKRAEEALKESEEKFRNLAEKSPNMIFINKKGGIVYANEKCEEIMGYTREEFYSPDFNFLSLIVPESRDLVKANFGKHMKGEEVPPYEYTLITKDGKRIDAIHTTRLIKYEGESAILGIITDITERKEIESRIQEYMEKLENSNRMKDLFTDILRHDLLNPAGVIRNATELMSEDDGREELGIIRNNVERIIDIINTASQLGKLEELDRLDKQKMDLGEVIRQVADEYTKALSDRGQEVVFDVKDKFEVDANPIIEQVFSNLISNAIKYSPKDSKIKIDVDADDVSWKIKVIDKCGGISDEDKDKLFTRFQRVKKESVKGTGLGLTIAKRIVELHDGEIGVEDNRDGDGCVFYVRLPKKGESNASRHEK